MKLIEAFLIKLQKRTGFFNKKKDIFSLDAMAFFYCTFLAITIVERIIKFAIFNTEYEHIEYFVVPVCITILVIISILITRYLFKRHFKKNSKAKLNRRNIDKFLTFANIIITTLLLEAEWIEIVQVSGNKDKNYFWLGEQLAILFTSTAFIVRSELYLVLLTLYNIIYPYFRFDSANSSPILGSSFFFKLIPLLIIVKLDRLFNEKFDDYVNEKSKDSTLSKKVLDVLPEGVCILDKKGLVYKNFSLKTILNEEDSDLLLKKLFSIENEEYTKYNKKFPNNNAVFSAEYNGTGAIKKPEITFGNVVSKIMQKEHFKAQSKLISEKMNGARIETNPVNRMSSMETQNESLVGKREAKKVKISKNLDANAKNIGDKALMRKGKTRDDDSHSHIEEKDIEPATPSKPVKRIKKRLRSLIESINQPYFKLGFKNVEEAVNHLLKQLNDQFPEVEGRDELPIPSLVEMEATKSSFKARTLTGNRYIKSLSVASTYCTMFKGKVTDDEESKNLEIKFTPLIFSGSNCIMVLIRDITEREQLRMLKEEDDNKIRALASISHEFRTPLNGIIVMLELLKSKVTKDLFTQTVTPAINSAKLLLFLVNDILDLHQIREGKHIIVPKLFNFKAAIFECMELISIQAKNKGLTLNTQYQNDVDEMMVNDPNRIKQILNNLLSNALKFTLKGSISVIVERISESRRLVQVIDTGIGIPKNKISGILGELGKIESSINRELNPQGVGLGLSITNKLSKLVCADEYDGGLIVTSILGKGSSFSFYVDNLLEEKPSFEADDEYRLTPFDKLTDRNNKSEMILSNILDDNQEVFRGGKKNHSNTKTHKDSEPIETSTKSSTVEALALIVDDNDFNLIALGSLLKIFGFKFITAYNGEQAMDILKDKRGQVNIIFLDIEMPVMDGRTCALQMREYLRSKNIDNLPIIGVTGNSAPDQHTFYLESGMDDILVKPVFQNSIKEVLNKWYFGK